MSLKRLLFFLVFCSLLVFPAAEEKSFLWELSVPYGKCYLLGTVHVLKKDHYPLPLVIEEAFAASELLLVEVDLSPEKMLPAAMKMLEHGMCRDQETIRDYLTAEAFARAETGMKNIGLDIDKFLKFKPWMLAALLLQKKLAQEGFDPEHGLDLYFLRKAAGNKEILELEGLDFQLGLFAGLSKEENSGLLLSAVLEAEMIGKIAEKIVQAWASGDKAALERFFISELVATPELKPFFRKLVDERNLQMVDKVIEYISAEREFFLAVGALHLIGEKGMVQLLRDRGYSLRQL